jgi:hypothetical protein
MTVPQLFSLALDKYNSALALDSTCAVTATVSDVREPLRNSAKGRVALSIVDSALRVGLSETSALHLAVIAAPESAFKATAVAGGTGASGYFQMVPKYWSTAGPTISQAILDAQVAQLADRYGSSITDDLAVLYGTHFFPSLGTAHRTFAALGYQVNSKTYSQYVFEDARGSRYHSPVFMAYYALAKFYELTGVDLSCTKPNVTSACVPVTANGRRQSSAPFQVDLPVKVTNASTFVRAKDAAEILITRMDAAQTDGGSSGLTAGTTDLSQISRPFTAGLLSYSISDGPPEHEVLTVSARFLTTYGDVDANMFLPSLETLMYAIRQGTVDLNVIKVLFSIVAMEHPVASSVESDGTRLKQSRFSLKLNNFLSAPGLFRSEIESLTDDDLRDFLWVLLHKQTQDLSIAMHASQLALHDPIVFHGDLNQNSGSLSVLFERGAEQARFDTPWAQYLNVLYPFSLLVTPAMGRSLNGGRLRVSSNTQDRMRLWASSVAATSGPAAAIDSIINKYIPKTFFRQRPSYDPNPDQ